MARGSAGDKKAGAGRKGAAAPRRSRRTPEEARRLVLDAAAVRLQEYGLKGLNIVDIARDAGMTHATVLHHFGSAEKMQRALVEDMTGSLLRDMVTALGGDGDLDGGELCVQLFEALTAKGHGKLIAWASVTDQRIASEAGDAERGALFSELVGTLSKRLKIDESTARHMVFLTATSALGAALMGDALAPMLGLSREEKAGFPQWLSGRMDRIVEDG